MCLCPTSIAMNVIMNYVGIDPMFLKLLRLIFCDFKDELKHDIIKNHCLFLGLKLKFRD